MAMEDVPFPVERKHLQTFKLLVQPPGAKEFGRDTAYANAVFLSPRQKRNAREQWFLVLKNSLVRKTLGQSDQPTAASAREKLRSRGVLRDMGSFDFLEADAAFPSLSRAANFLCGRAENGWALWHLASEHNPASASEAYDADLKGSLELNYYTPPKDVIWIPK